MPKGKEMWMRREKESGVEWSGVSMIGEGKERGTNERSVDEYNKEKNIFFCRKSVRSERIESRRSVIERACSNWQRRKKKKQALSNRIVLREKHTKSKVLLRFLVVLCECACGRNGNGNGNGNGLGASEVVGVTVTGDKLEELEELEREIYFTPDKRQKERNNAPCKVSHAGGKVRCERMNGSWETKEKREMSD